MSDTPDASTPASTPNDPAAQPVTPPAAPVVQVLPPENVLRGTLLALLIIPAGIIVWDIVWALGFVAGIVAIGVAIGALALYRLGSGGRVSMSGAVRVSVIIVVTLILAFISGFIVDDPSYFLRALSSGRFVDAIGYRYETGGMVINVLLVLAFAVLGVVTVFRTAATQKKQEEAANTVLPPSTTVP